VGVARAKRALWGKNDFSVSSNPGRGGISFVFEAGKFFFGQRGSREKSFCEHCGFCFVFWLGRRGFFEEKTDQSIEPASLKPPQKNILLGWHFFRVLRKNNTFRVSGMTLYFLCLVL